MKPLLRTECAPTGAQASLPAPPRRGGNRLHSLALLRVAAAALLLCVPAHAAAPPPQWLPQDSWPGGKQYDARLGRTVTFWGTGVPAAEVFTSITKQTGVALGFDPPDDDNARICLNVYLNPKEPPTLRDVLVQIGWVMDCAWAVEGEGEQSRYVLLHTTLGEGGLEQRRRREREAWEAQYRASEEAEREFFLRAKTRLRELGPDLALSREKAIERYRGKDNLRLIVLLDPVRRAAARLLLASPDLVDQVDPHHPVRSAWSELSAEQRRWALEMIHAERARLAPGGPFGEPDPHAIDWDEPAAPGRFGLYVDVQGSSSGFQCMVCFPDEEPGGTRVEAYANVDLLPRPEPSYAAAADVQLELRGLLGEKVPPEEWTQTEMESSQRQYREKLAHDAEAQLAQYGPTAPGNLARLSSRLPVTADTPYALWQLQELTAVTSGLSVISDHFWQPPYPLSQLIGLLCPGSPPDLTALTVLRLASISHQSLEGATWLIGYTSSQQVEAWEWGDAGSFLRFRSRNRDLWRAALLPETAAATLDQWLAPYLPAQLSEGAAWPEVEVPLDLVRQSRLLAGLDEAQCGWGGLIAAGAPTDPAEAYRQTFREGVLAATTRAPYQLPANLSEERVALLEGEGLVAGIDIPLADIPWPLDPHRGVSIEKGTTLSLIRPEFEHDSDAVGPNPGRRAAAYHITAWWQWLLTTPQGERVPLLLLFPRNLLLRPQRLPHLVAPPPEYAR